MPDSKVVSNSASFLIQTVAPSTTNAEVNESRCMENKLPSVLSFEAKNDLIAFLHKVQLLFTVNGYKYAHLLLHVRR